MKKKNYFLIVLLLLLSFAPIKQTKHIHTSTINRIDYKSDSNDSYEIQQVKMLTVAVQVQGDFDENVKSSPITCKCHVQKITRLIYMDGSEELDTKSVVYMDKVGELMKATKHGYTFVEWTNEEGQAVNENTIINSTKEYRIYAQYNIIISNLVVDPNGGTWNDSTGTQNFSISYNDTKDIPDPTRIGYTFKGWEITGEDSTYSEENKKFTMGVTDSTLKAKWEANTYNIIIDPNGGTYAGKTTTTKISAKYEQTTTIEMPRRTGYTFTHWTYDKGRLDSNTSVYLNHAGDINLKANWTINSYDYIAYHQQQNANGTGFYTVDSFSGQAVYNTIVSPDVKTYTGFTSPSRQNLTIDEDTSPPTKNIVNYNYYRIKNNLTINPNGGTYAGTSSSTIVSLNYEQDYTVSTPTRYGYNFVNWTKTSNDSLLISNIFTMKLNPTTLTANWSAVTNTLTYNVNGGSAVSPNYKQITYGQKYGTLTTTSRTGYTFKGWYTSSTGGTRVDENTIHNNTSNVNLYAQWHNDAPVINSTKVTYDNNPGSTDNGILKGGTETITFEVNASDVQDGTPSVSISCSSGITLCGAITISSPTVSSGKYVYTIKTTSMGFASIKVTAKDKANAEKIITVPIAVYGEGGSISKNGTFTDNTYNSGFTDVLEGCYISNYTFNIQIPGHGSGGNYDSFVVTGKTDSNVNVTIFSQSLDFSNSMHTYTDNGLSGFNTGKGNYIVSINFYASVPSSHRSCVNKSSTIVNYSIRYTFSKDLLPE